MSFKIAILLSFVLIGFVLAQAPTSAGCSCTDDQCACCAEIPGIQTDVCANLEWFANNQTLQVAATFAGANILNSPFSKSQPSQCVVFFLNKVKICINLDNFVAQKQGACGCFDVTGTAFGVDVKAPLGCFVVGSNPTCTVPPSPFKAM
jgi:hypothetical protein